jgi:hypothetical protein
VPPVELILFIAFCIAAAQSLETFGIWGRVWGSLNGMESSGYSLHVRIATLGRFLTFAVAPTLGYLVDIGEGATAILYISLSTYSLIFMSSFAIFFVSKQRVFDILSKIQRAQPTQVVDSHLRFDKSIVLGGIIAFSLTSSGLLIANFLASQFVEYTGMLVQLTSIITAGGTLIHVFFVDPKISNYCDNSVDDSLLAANSYILSRMVGSSLLLTLTVIILLGGHI